MWHIPSVINVVADHQVTKALSWVIHSCHAHHFMGHDSLAWWLMCVYIFLMCYSHFWNFESLSQVSFKMYTAAWIWGSGCCSTFFSWHHCLISLTSVMDGNSKSGRIYVHNISDMCQIFWIHVSMQTLLMHCWTLPLLHVACFLLQFITSAIGLDCIFHDSTVNHGGLVWSDPLHFYSHKFSVWLI